MLVNIGDRLIDNLNIFEDCEETKEYFSFIANNLTTQHIKYKTQVHHIIPKFVFKLLNLKVDDTLNNKVNLLYKDHIYAHYLLAVAINEKFKDKAYYSLHYLLGQKGKHNEVDVNELVSSLPKYQELYERNKVTFGNKRKGITLSDEIKQKVSISLKGKKRTPMSQEARKHLSELRKGKKKKPHSLETRIKISNSHQKHHKNLGKPSAIKDKIGMSKDGVSIYVSKDKINNYLLDGWVVGNPNAKKKGFKIMYKGNEERQIPLNDVDEFINNGWKLGYIKPRTKGMKLNNEVRKKHSDAMLGLNKGKIHLTNGVVNKMACPDEVEYYINLGFWRGRTLKKHKKEN